MNTTPTSGAADLPEALRRSTAADGKTELLNLPGYPLMVRAVDFNRLHTESEMRRTALLDEMQKAALAAGQATAQPAPENIRGILARCRDFIDTTKAPAYPAGADLADEIDALLAAQAVVPAEWPTNEMIDAGRKAAASQGRLLGSGQSLWHVFRAMLAAAPAQPAAQQGVAYAALPESFLEIPDVQDESGINAYYSREVVLECIDAALASHGQAPAAAAPAAESVPAIQGEMNVQLDIDSNHSAPGQQRDVARSVALGQPVGNRSDQVAGHPSAQGDKLLTVAERNIRSFLRSATFKSESDREAALNCVDVLWAAARDPADSVQEDAALWHWLAEYLVGTRTDLDDEIVASETVNDLRKLVEAARKQGTTP